jgi:hypothetical protein
VKPLNLLDINLFEILAPQYPTHYLPAGNGDVLDIVEHMNLRISVVIVSDILDSDHLPIVLNLLDNIKTRNLTDPVDKFTDWERFRRLASELNSSRIQINSGTEVNKAARDFIASIDSAFRLPVSKLTLSDLNKRRLTKVWQVTRDQHVKGQLTGTPKPSDE